RSSFQGKTKWRRRISRCFLGRRRKSIWSMDKKCQQPRTTTFIEVSSLYRSYRRQDRHGYCQANLASHHLRGEKGGMQSMSPLQQDSICRIICYQMSRDEADKEQEEKHTHGLFPTAQNTG